MKTAAVICATFLIATPVQAAQATRHFTFINATKVCAEVVLVLDYRGDASHVPAGDHRSVPPGSAWSGSFVYDTDDEPRGHIIVDVAPSATCAGETGEVRLTTSLGPTSARSRIILHREASGTYSLTRTVLP